MLAPAEELLKTLQMMPTLLPVIGQHGISGPSAADINLPLLVMQFCVTLWVFVLGACFGSFLNVVIYRLPVGMSLGRPKSHCPRCETPLAARDNLPVIGWLLLRGRCRYCDLPISVRYPLIESVCGAVFLLLLFSELLTGAANLPLRHPDHFAIRSGFWLVYFAKWNLLGIYLLHCTLLIVTLATCMIGYDGHSVPRRLITFIAVTGMVVGTIWPELRPVRALWYPPAYYDWNLQLVWTDPLVSPGAIYATGVTTIGFLDGLSGLIFGSIAAAGIVWQAKTLTDEQSRRSLSAAGWSFIGVGTILGWQGCGMLAVLTIPLITIVAFATRFKAVDRSDRTARSAGPVFFLLLSAFIPCWQYLHAAPWMIGVHGISWTAFGTVTDWAITLSLLAALSVVNRLVFPATPVESASNGAAS